MLLLKSEGEKVFRQRKRTDRNSGSPSGMTRRQFCALLGAGMAGSGVLLGKIPHASAEEVFPAEPLPFSVVSIPEMTADPQKATTLIGRYHRGEIPAAAVLRWERYVPQGAVSVLVRRFSEAGMMPLCRSAVFPKRLFPLAGASNILTDSADGTFQTVVFLELERTSWSCYMVPKPEPILSGIRYETARLEFARCLDQVLKTQA